MGNGAVPIGPKVAMFLRILQALILRLLVMMRWTVGAVLMTKIVLILWDVASLVIGNLSQSL